MPMLYDRHFRMPYHVLVPWPTVTEDGQQQDWILACTAIETWLETTLGPHWQYWAWDMLNLDNSKLCGVRFSRESHSVMFLLKWG